MELEPWIRKLHEKIGPPTQSTDRVVAYLQPRLNDLNPLWFTEPAIEAVFLKLRTLNSADRVRKVLRDFHAKQPPTAPRAETPMQQDWRNWNERQQFLRKDWDDKAGIIRKVRECDGHPMRIFLLGQLGLILARHAPQHLGLLPPDILRDMRRNASPALGDLLHPMPIPLAPTLTKNEQLDALNEPTPIARHLSPQQLDVVNPLPNGKKRANSTNDINKIKDGVSAC